MILFASIFAGLPKTVSATGTTTITFRETGLATHQEWVIMYDSTAVGAYAPSNITVSGLTCNQSFKWEVQAMNANLYTPYLNGTDIACTIITTQVKSNMVITIGFNANIPIAWVESGLPNGIIWSVTTNVLGTYIANTPESITQYFASGTSVKWYFLTVPTGYTPHPINGSLTVTTAETINIQFSKINCAISPSSTILPIGGSQPFTCSASGGISPYTYGWYVNNQLMQSGNSNTYMFTALQSQQATNVTIECQVTDSTGTTGIANAYSYVELPNDKVAIVTKSTSKLELDGVMYHDWSSGTPNYDYWAIEVTLSDLKYKNSGTIDSEIHPWTTTIELEMNSFCEEFPANHLPQQGDYGSSQASLGFSYMGIGFSIQGSAYSVSFREWHDPSTDNLVCQWTFDFGTFLGIPAGLPWHTGGPFPWIDYVQVSIGVRTPVAYKPTVQIGASNVWELHTYIPNRFYYADSDYVWDSPLDPPESVPITPKNMSTAPLFNAVYQTLEVQNTLNLTKPVFTRPFYYVDETPILNNQSTVISLVMTKITGKTEWTVINSIILAGPISNYYFMPFAVPRSGIVIAV